MHHPRVDVSTTPFRSPHLIGHQNKRPRQPQVMLLDPALLTSRCACVRACAHACVYVYTYTHTYMPIHMHTCACAWACTCGCVCLCLHACVYVYAHVCMCMGMYVWMCVCLCLHACGCVCGCMCVCARGHARASTCVRVAFECRAQIKRVPGWHFADNSACTRRILSQIQSAFPPHE